MSCDVSPKTSGSRHKWMSHLLGASTNDHVVGTEWGRGTLWNRQIKLEKDRDDGLKITIPAGSVNLLS